MCIGQLDLSGSLANDSKNVRITQLEINLNNDKDI